MNTKGSLGFCVLLAAVLGGPPVANAQEYPARPVRLIVPLAPGGAMDTVARAVAQKLTGNFRQTVVVDNRGGGGGSIGAEITMRATPDGYTLMMGSASYLIHALMYRAPYHPVRDFVPVTQVTTQPYVLVVHPAVPANTISEFIAVLRAKPGQYSFASAGSGSLIHLTTELFKALSGVEAVHVPFKGMGAAYPDLLSGRLQFAFGSIISSTPHLKSGKLRGLGVTSRTRAASLPELPPLAEAGVPGFDVTQWYGLLAPLKTPRAVIARVQREVASVLRQPDIVARFAADGSEPVGSTPENFGAHIRDEYERWSKVIKQAGIRAD
ncbi:MAG: tripartite tricarboxylate transporter substrate binding protein [Betaproteobacteria bacterium]|nr:tripartite tricarboxylate transporter substrate binding protein [Betaproteobacteria bacterium]